MSLGLLSPASRLHRRPDVLQRTVAGDAVLIARRTLGVHVLNGVGERVWELADGATLSEIASRIGAEYVAELDRIADDVRAFAEKMVEEGLLEASE